MGNVLGVGSTVAEGTKTIFTKTAQTGLFAGKQVLNNWGSAVIGASSAASSVVANKLVGNRASFRWGDVAASAVASGLSSHTGQIGLDNSNPVSSIVNSGLRYGADKVFGNQASWNFGNVAVDAFGNALGNSIVGGIQRSEAEKNNRNRYIEAMGQKLTSDTARKIDGQLATDLNNSLNTTMQGVDASVERMMSANNRNQQIDTNAQFAADEAKRASRQQGVVDRANGLSASLSSQASTLESRHRNQIAGIQATADAAFAKGVARGEAMYAAGVRNREQIGVDLLAGVDVEGNIAWGQQQRSKFNQFYKELNPVQKYAFDKATAIGNKASDIFFGPRGLPNAIETELNIAGNIPMLEAGFGLSATVDSYGRFTFTGGVTATLTSDISANISAALGQVKGYGADSVALGTGEAVSTTADVSIVDVIVDKNSKLGTLLKARPLDVFGGYEDGYTQNGTYWDFGNKPNVMPAENLYHFKGGYVGGSVGWKGLYEFNASPMYKALGLEKLTIGKTYEYAASGFTTQPSVIGRVTYNLLDIFHD